MTLRIAKLSPEASGAYRHRAAVLTRDRGRLVGVRVIRAATERDLDRKLAQFRGANARDDLATERNGSAEAEPSDAPKG